MRQKGEGWRDIPPDKQEDLIEWYNVAEPDTDDKQLLADLYHSGRFSSWNCSYCGDTVLVGQPESWDKFQGVCQHEHLGNLCEGCAGKYLSLKACAGE